jgi:hypothetical protein
MRAFLSVAGSLAGWVGILVCLAAGLLRVGGSYHFGGYEVMTIFNAGLGLILAGAFVKLEALGNRR